MSAQLHLHTASLERGPVHLEGTLRGAVLDLGNDPTVRNVGDIFYELDAERKSTDILIRGSVRASMDLECARSGRFFSTEVKESAFVRDYSISECPTGVMDLTEDVREAVLLAIPTYPVSPEARDESFTPPGINPGGDETESDNEPGTEGSPWSALNNLNLP
ncbi:MAG: hypothetical protein JJU05_11425 [Verrucomicrobia bacterium]|nr:hypothetical protein [Verrucomicrobiota bacterium]MCH8527256.1 DUF177 domain-containing protein [Kiritimatiellia bacterium]